MLFINDLPEEAKKLDTDLEIIEKKPIEDEKIYSFETYVGAFLYSVELLKERAMIPFDKDDKIAIMFVAAASNLRALNYNIDQLNLFKIKEIAGNIIPAVATTNAMAAGLQVIEALKILENKNEPKNVWISEHPTDNKIIISGGMPGPVPKCYTCSIGIIKAKLNFQKFTLGDLVSKILKNDLSMQNPSLVLENGNLLYEFGEDLDEDDVERYAKLYKLTLTELKLEDGVRITCDNFNTDFQIKLILMHDESQELYEIVADLQENEHQNTELKRKRSFSPDIELKKRKVDE